MPLPANLGTPEAFDASLADFSAITGDSRRLMIERVLHQADIAVDEKGTEAAAATAVVIGTPSVPESSIVFDRPFLFLIVDQATQSVLFVGRVLDPTQS